MVMCSREISPQEARHEVPFQWIKEGIPLIAFESWINGQGPFKLVLDTGNGTSLILSKAAATRLKLSTMPEELSKRAYSVGKEDKPHLEAAAVNSLSVGSLKWEGIQAKVSGIVETLNERIGAEHDGNLGFELLKNLAVTIDYKTMKLTFIENPEPRQNGTPFRILDDAPLILVEVWLAGNRPYTMVLDTGASATVLSRNVGRELGLQEQTEVSLTGATGGVGGFIGKLPSLRMGSRTRKDVTVVLADFVEDMAKAIGAEAHGIVGFNVLNGGSLAIDYKNRQIAVLDESEQ